MDVIGRRERVGADGIVIENNYELLWYCYDEDRWEENGAYSCDKPNTWATVEGFLWFMKEIVLDDLAMERTKWLQKNKRHLIMDKLTWNKETPEDMERYVGRYDEVGIDGNVIESDYGLVIYDKDDQRWRSNEGYVCDEPNAWLIAELFLSIMREVVLDDLARRKTKWLQNSKRHLIGHALGLYRKQQRLLR